jgi:hypothetical protein
MRNARRKAAGRLDGRHQRAPSAHTGNFDRAMRKNIVHDAPLLAAR